VFYVFIVTVFVLYLLLTDTSEPTANNSCLVVELFVKVTSEKYPFKLEIFCSTGFLNMKNVLLAVRPGEIVSTITCFSPMVVILSYLVFEDQTES